MLTIRLRRTGAKKDPHYRVVVIDRAAGRDGPFLEILGHYHPRRRPAEIVFDRERTESWLAQGAQMSDTVGSLYRRVKSGRVEEVEAAPAVPATDELAASDDAEATDELAAAADAEATEEGAAAAPEADEVAATRDGAEAGDDGDDAGESEEE